MGCASCKDRREERLVEVHRNHCHRILEQYPGVTAVDINYRQVRGILTVERCIQVWVREKKHESFLPAYQILPKEIEGCHVDVIQGEAKLLDGEWPDESKLRLLDDDTEDFQLASSAASLKLRPLDTLRGGDSLGIQNVDAAGTLGYFVKKKSAVGVLTNSHVTDGVGNKMWSPSKRDGGTNNDYIGTTKSAVVSTDVDCAYIPLRGNVTKYKLLDGTSVIGTSTAVVTDPYKFFGRTTYRTTGRAGTGSVSSVTWTGVIQGKTFNNQILMSGNVMGGDSGSLLVDRANNTAMGLVFATTGTNGLANHISAVKTALGITIA